MAFKVNGYGVVVVWMTSQLSFQYC
jgi:acetylornithine deacetylase/succinyl-diaminopimelate desuccinylase-like protein